MKMKLFIAACLALVIAISCNINFNMPSDEEIFKQFQHFTETHNKRYGTIEETKERFEIFKQNYKRISMQKFMVNQHNQEHDSSFEIGITQFFDMTPLEFQKTYLNLNVSHLQRLKLLYSEKDLDITYAKGAAPEAYDWRETGVVSQVKSQGMCGSCWAFSAIGNIEALYGIKTNKTTLFSEQQLVDCDKEQDHGCNGGLMDNAFTYLEKTGVMLAKDYPYAGRDQACKFDQNKVAAKVTGYRFATGKSAETVNENDLKQLLFENGPFSIAINATPLQFYLWGIFNPWFEFICNPKELNHGVLLVGYGVSGKTPYWIIKNSWGKSWGEKGYFRLIGGKGACGFNTYVVTAEVEDI